jgi:hypothetical protein
MKCYGLQSHFRHGDQNNHLTENPSRPHRRLTHNQVNYRWQRAYFMTYELTAKKVLRKKNNGVSIHNVFATT